MSMSSAVGSCVIVLAAMTIASTSIGDAPIPQTEKRIAWANEPDVLVGLKAVNLHLAIRGDVKNAKAGEEWLRTKIERRLRQTGLAVLTNDEAASQEVPVMLTIIIDSRAIGRQTSDGAAGNGGGIYLVMIHLHDIVVPYRDSESVILGATTWSRRRFGYAGGKELPSKSMDVALVLVDEFCNDYAATQER